MNIEQSTVKKLHISGLQDLDPISVYLEDFGLGRGKITITCFDQSWTNYWGAMAERSMAEFFLDASVDYLTHKLKTGIKETVTDYDAIEAKALEEIERRVKSGDLDVDEAADLTEEVEHADFNGQEINSDLLYRVFGDEWWGDLPEEPNHEYTYLCRIINAVKQALQQVQEVQEVPA